MKLFSPAIAIASFVATAALNSVAAEGGEGEKSWGYKNNDPSIYGPAEWRKEYPTCTGKRQSPIDITLKTLCGDESAKRAAPLAFAGACSDYKLTANDGAYKGTVQNGTCAVSASGKPYSMVQFHMHAPSEHKLKGKAYDGEAHFVHQNADGSGLLVVGLFLEKNERAKTDPWLTSVWDSLSKVTQTSPVDTKLGSYTSLLTTATPKGLVFNYPGSLTIPVCSEIVDWWVLQQPVQVASADFIKFQGYLKKLPGRTPAAPRDRRRRSTVELSLFTKAESIPHPDKSS